MMRFRQNQNLIILNASSQALRKSKHIASHLTVSEKSSLKICITERNKYIKQVINVNFKKKQKLKKFISNTSQL